MSIIDYSIGFLFFLVQKPPEHVEAKTDGGAKDTNIIVISTKKAISNKVAFFVENTIEELSNDFIKDWERIIFIQIA